MTKEYLPVMEEKFEVRSFTVDMNNRLKLNYLTAFLQEAAWKHARHLDFGYEYMREKNVAWMLSKIRIEMHEFPKWCDLITIETWPKGIDGISFVRDFFIKDDSGKNIGAATSNWLLVDLNSKRPKIPEFHTEVLTKNKDRHGINMKLSKIASECPEETDVITVKYGDIDLNNHVNSNKYVEWITNALPQNLFNNHRIQTFQINYLHEVKETEQVQIGFTEENAKKHYLVGGMNLTTGKPCFQAVIEWSDII